MNFNYNMKRSKIIVSALGVVAIVASTLVWNSLNQNIDAKYVSTKGSLETERSASDYQKWVESKMIDSETGEVITPEKLRQINKTLKLQPKSLTVEWKEQGPDNIGGRTRALLIDHTDQNVIWAGGVSGGLFKSNWKGNLWNRVDNFPGNQFISSLTQDADGNVYVATGSISEGNDFRGNGLYVTPDGGESWELVPGTENFTIINRVRGTRHSSKVFFTASGGLKEYVYGGAVIDVPNYPSNSARTIEISSDGQVVVCADNNHRTYVSLDGGDTWENRSGNGDGELSPSGVGRIEYAISTPKSNGKYSIYASTASSGFGGSNNQGQWISIDDGVTWHKHTPATAAGIANGVIDFRDQGTWGHAVTFDPTDPTRAIIGGIDLHEWKQTIDNPPSGGWNKISLWNVNPTSDVYVHADNHILKWNDANELFVGNDGGIQISTDKGETFYPANRGYNIAQFFKIAYDRNGAVLGGTQDNGSLYNDHTNSTFEEFTEVTGGDGFSAVISFFNPNVMITSSQYNTIRRSGDGGVTFSDLVPQWPSNVYNPTGSGGTEHPFHTMFVLGEYFDEDSEDSVIFVPQASYDADDVVKVPSLASGDTILYTTPNEIFFTDTLYYFSDSTRVEYEVTDEESGTTYDLGISEFSYFATASGAYPPIGGDSLLVEVPTGQDTVVVDDVTPYNYYVGVNEETDQAVDMVRDTVLYGVPWDTLTVQDPYQSWFLVATELNGGEIWGTRDALRLSVAQPKWVRIAENLGGAALDMELSRDLNHLFVAGGFSIGSSNHSALGPIYRIDGLGSVYTSDENFEGKLDIDDGATATTKTLVSNGSFNGIGIDPDNPDDLVATQGFNGNVYRSSNATAVNPSLTVVGSQNGASFYDVIIDREDSDILFAATHVGVSLSEDGGATWTDVSDPSFAGTPTFHILQSWRGWEEGNYRPGSIYVGTHGRGIFSTAAVLNVNDESEEVQTLNKEKSSLQVYPNPSKYNSTLVFDLKSEANVDIQFFNLSGRLVKSINKPNMFVGKNEVSFSASELPQGTYLIRVQAGSQIETIKYIKL